ncbi:MAG: sulfate transporter [Planctomycetes bacterium]|nr:sulfate transporter [Planctomycetota bacterium]
MTQTRVFSLATVPKDLTAGLVVFLVALPLCLGVALASNAPLISGIVAGVIGGILVGIASGSHTSVSGPAAGLTAVVAAQITELGSFSAFLLAVLIAGLFQIALGSARSGFIAAYFPTSVIKGLLAAIGTILVLKQIPHLLGHDADPEGEMAFRQPDHETTFSEFGEILADFHLGAAAIGVASIVLLLLWDRIPRLKKSVIPSPLVAVALGTALSELFRGSGGSWEVGIQHLVQVPIAEEWSEWLAYLHAPDFTQWTNPAIYTSALTIALVASLETLLNVEAVDKLDPRQRTTPASRELIAQGAGNVASGLLGGLPVTSVVVRSSVNINAGGRSKLATVTHGVLLLTCVTLLPEWLNRVPLSCLAAILIVTGFKLASPRLFRQMWSEGRNQFLPFAVTVGAIVLTDLLIGILVGLAVSIGFILNSNLRRPIRRYVEMHLGGDVLHIELANQVSFLNRGALQRVLLSVPRGGHILLDATDTDYIDPDVLDLLRDFRGVTAPIRGIEVSMVGFRGKYAFEDRIQYVDYSTRDLRDAMTPFQVLKVLRDGNERFRSGQQLTRDLCRQATATADGQHPMAVVLSCIDSRTPAELIFDLGVGDIFSVRIAGNVSSPKILGSIEYGCAVAGAKLLLVLGHSRCGAVTSAIEFLGKGTAADATGCGFLDAVLGDIQRVCDKETRRGFETWDAERRARFIDATARANVQGTVRSILEQSRALAELQRCGKILVVGAFYDLATCEMTLVE